MKVDEELVRGWTEKAELHEGLMGPVEESWAV